MVEQETQPRKRLRTEQGEPPEQGQPGTDAVLGAAPTAPAEGSSPPSIPGNGCMKVAAPASHIPPNMASMGMPCNGCGCGASLGSNPGMLGIMQQQQQQQQYMMHQMGMLNHMMMMGAIMNPMMGQMMPPTPTDGTLLATASPSSLPDPALVANKLNKLDEDDDDPRRTCDSLYYVMHASEIMPCSVQVDCSSSGRCCSPGICQQPFAEVPPGPSSNINHPNYRPPDVEPMPGWGSRSDVIRGLGG